MDSNSDHILQLEITIEQLIKERDILTTKYASLKIQNEYQSQQIDSLREKLRSQTLIASKHASSTSINQNTRNSKIPLQFLNSASLSPRERTSGTNQIYPFNSTIPQSQSDGETQETSLQSLPSMLSIQNEKLNVTEGESIIIDNNAPPVLQSTYQSNIYQKPAIDSAPILPLKDISRLKSITKNTSTIPSHDNFASTRAVLKTVVNVNHVNESKSFSKPYETGMHGALRQKETYDVLVLTSCIKFPEQRELLTFIISIKDKEKDMEMWRIEKSYADFGYLEESVPF